MVAEALQRVPPLADIRAERARRHLSAFVAQAWHVVEPATPYRPNWHIDAICAHLEAVLRGEIRQLLINMPPRMMKSLTVSVFFPAWTWINRPGARFLYSSYAQSLSTDHSLATRRVIESDWYQERWGDRYQLAGDQNLKTKFENDHRGARLSTSVGGAATGTGGDFVIVDDPHSVKEAESDAVREATLLWWDQVMSTRLNDPKTGAKIIVMQRVHDKDLSGHVLAQGGYEHLCLPMEYEPTAHVTGIGWTDPRTVEGELLAPDRFGAVEVERAKRTLGSRGYAGQMQQRPVPAEGGTFKRQWWRRYRSLPVSFKRVEILVDSAFKDGVANDFSALSLWAQDYGDKTYLIRAWRGQWQFPELIKAGHEAHAWAKARFVSNAIPLVVEDKASGQSAIQVWSRPYHSDAGIFPALPVIAFGLPAGQSKEARAEGVTPWIEGGMVALPGDDCVDPRVGDIGWLDDWLLEHDKYPAGEHDDFVDTTAMFLTRAFGAEKGSQSGGWSRNYLQGDDDEPDTRGGRW